MSKSESERQSTELLSKLIEISQKLTAVADEILSFDNFLECAVIEESRKEELLKKSGAAVGKLGATIGAFKEFAQDVRDVAVVKTEFGATENITKSTVEGREEKDTGVVVVTGLNGRNYSYVETVQREWANGAKFTVKIGRAGIIRRLGRMWITAYDGIDCEIIYDEGRYSTYVKGHSN